MFYYNDIEDSMKNYYSIDVEPGFHEYTIDKNTIQSSAWSNESVYKNFKFDYDKQTGLANTALAGWKKKHGHFSEWSHICMPIVSLSLL